MKRGFELISRDFHTCRDLEGYLHRAIMKSGLGLARSVKSHFKRLFIYIGSNFGQQWHWRTVRGRNVAGN